MRINGVSQNNTAFSGDVIVYVPREVSADLDKFCRLSVERIKAIVKDAPFDVFIKEGKHGNIDVSLKRTEDEKINPFTILFLEDEISKAKDKITLDKIVEEMKRFEQEIFKKTEIREPIAPKIKPYTPYKIGNNSKINNKPKSNTKFIKHR